jgi:hypothetical protein
MKNNAIVYGLYAGLVLILISLISNLLNLVDLTNPRGFVSMLINMLNYAIMGIAMVLAVKNFRDNENGGVVSFGKGFGIGFTTLLTIIVISVVWSYVYFSLIDPAMLETIKDISTEQMREQGLTEDQIEQAASFNSMFMSPLGISIMAGISLLFIGLIIDVVVAAVMKKEYGSMA